MIINKSKRYRQERDKLSGARKMNSKIADGAEVKKTMKKQQYTQFNIRPGMMTWHGMPEDYKRAYEEQANRVAEQRVAEKEASAAEIQRRNEQIQKDKALEARIKQMQNRLGQKDNKFHDTSGKKKSTDVHMDNAVCNFIDRSFFQTRAALVDKNRDAETPINLRRPKILVITDVCGWAWWNKSRYLQMYLRDEFEIDVICVLGPEAKGINNGKYDLYLTYGYSYVGHLQAIDIKKRITGITAHRPRNTIKNYMGLAENLHANSIMLYEELCEIMGRTDRIFYVPNGVDEHIFKSVKPIGEHKALIAGHVGKKCPAKGQSEFILPAMERATNVESSYNMSDYRNRKPYCEMFETYQNMDVFLVASVEDGTPNGALEAAACGRPIISNRIGNMPEFIEDGINGFLVDRNVDAYVEKLNYLSENRDVLKRMGKAARETIEKNWTWKAQAENYRTMFQQILK